MKAKKDQLNKENIAALLGDGFDVAVEECMDSTNTELWKRGMAGAKDKTLLIAKSQRCGKGRLGRSFVSEEGGLYMSLLLRPSLIPADTALITPLAALAVAETIEKHTGKNALIKWVNDVFCDGKKVCGILTEASLDPVTVQTNFVVVGVGLNVYAPEEGFPENIKGIAGALFEADYCEEGLMDIIAADVAKGISDYSQRINDKAPRDNYKKRCFVLGKDVTVHRGGESYETKAVDIDDRFGLITEGTDGKPLVLSSGEISVRVKDGV